MARPKESSTAVSARERILSNAAQLFYQKGINNVGINEVIECSNIARMTLYHHFASKDDIVSAVLQRQMLERQTQMLSAVKRARTGRTKVLAAFDYLAGIVCADGYRGCAFINAAVELADSSHPAHVLAAAHKRWIAGLFEQIASDAHWQDPPMFAQQCMLLWDGANAGTQMHRNTMPVRAARLAAIALIQAAQA